MGSWELINTVPFLHTAARNSRHGTNEWQQKSRILIAKHVSYFHGCYVNYNFPQLGKDLVKIMNAVGYGVHLLEKEKCCGVALIANGLSGQLADRVK